MCGNSFDIPSHAEAWRRQLIPVEAIDHVGDDTPFGRHRGENLFAFR